MAGAGLFLHTSWPWGNWCLQNMQDVLSVMKGCGAHELCELSSLAACKCIPESKSVLCGYADDHYSAPVNFSLGGQVKKSFFCNCHIVQAPAVRQMLVSYLISRSHGRHCPVRQLTEDAQHSTPSPPAFFIRAYVRSLCFPCASLGSESTLSCASELRFKTLYCVLFVCVCTCACIKHCSCEGHS